MHEVAPHGFAVQLLLRIRFEQGGDLRIGQRGTEPAALIVGTENDGHPAVGVVDVAHQRIGFGSDYRECRRPRSGRTAVPAIVNPGQ